MDQRLKPGEHLNIDRLASEIGTSPTPVREALNMLAGLGLVRRVDRGFRVSPFLTRDQFVALFQARRLLELGAARLARMPTRKEMAEMQRRTSDLEVSLAGEDFGEYSTFLGSDEACHRLLVNLADNEYISRAWDGLHAHLHIARLYRRKGGVIRHKESIEAHTRIKDALIEGRPFIDELERHLHGAEEYVLEAIDDLEERSPGSD